MHPVAIRQAVVGGQEVDQLVGDEPAVAQLGKLPVAHANEVVHARKQPCDAAVAVELLPESHDDVVERLVADHPVMAEIKPVRDGLVGHGFFRPRPISSSVNHSRSFIVSGNFEVQSLPA